MQPQQGQPRNQQQQEPLALLGGNGQDRTVIAFAQGFPIEDGTGVANQQTTVLRKHMIWALALVVLGTVVVVAIVVVVVVVATLNSKGERGGPTPSPVMGNPPAVPPPTLAPPVVPAPTVPIAAPSLPTVAPVAAPTTVSPNSPSTVAPAPIPTGSPPTVAPVVPPTTVPTNSPSNEVSTPIPTGSPTATVVLLENSKLTASDGAAGDEFGFSVAIAGDIIVVGAQRDDDNGNIDSGSAHIFTRTGTIWTQQAKLLASDSGAFDFFGTSGH